MKQMTKSACVGLTASILLGGCAGNAASRGNEERANASAATAQTEANAPTADASSSSSKSSAASADTRASTSAAPAANAPTASAATPGMGMGSGMSSGAQANERRGEFQGRIERLDRADNAVIAGSESVGLAFEEFKIDDKTQVTTPSGKGTVAEINEGDEVRASFSGSGEDLHVDKLQVVTPKRAEDDKAR